MDSIFVIIKFKVLVVMSNLNKILLETSFNWFVEHGLRPHIFCYGNGIIKSPALLSNLRPTELPGLETIVLNVSPHSAPVVFADDYLHVKCRVGGRACEEFIPYENIWMIGEPTNPLLMIHLPQHQVLPEQIDFEEVRQQVDKKKETAKPKFGIIDGGKS